MSGVGWRRPPSCSQTVTAVCYQLVFGSMPNIIGLFPTLGYSSPRTRGAWNQMLFPSKDHLIYGALNLSSVILHLLHKDTRFRWADAFVRTVLFIMRLSESCGTKCTAFKGKGNMGFDERRQPPPRPLIMYSSHSQPSFGCTAAHRWPRNYQTSFSMPERLNHMLTRLCTVHR